MCALLYNARSPLPENESVSSTSGTRRAAHCSYLLETLRLLQAAVQLAPLLLPPLLLAFVAQVAVCAILAGQAALPRVQKRARLALPRLVARRADAGQTGGGIGERLAAPAGDGAAHRRVWFVGPWRARLLRHNPDLQHALH
mmetsp:Transcript_83170/g.231444  ORF Transcript_83170/g.231444 Transcript_83170/m.231444 type:complete len:142 (-) Transcript_83170:398-823(-)